MASASSATSSPILDGFPREIFANGFDNKFICGICKKILRDPKQNICGHRFCFGCIKQKLSEKEKAERGGKPPRCPCCIEEGVPEAEIEELSMEKMYPDNAVKRDMTKMDTHCVNLGCSWIGKFKDYQLHEQSCEYQPKVCALCGELVSSKKQKDHETKECVKRKINCKFCQEIISQDQAEVHNNRCSKFPVKCEACGKKKIPRNQMQDHLNRECNKRVIACPVGCPDMMNQDKFLQHLTVTKNVATHLFWVMDKLVILENQVMNGINPQTPQGDLSQMMASITELDRKVQELQRQPQGRAEGDPTGGKLIAMEAKVSAFEPIMGVLHKEIERCLTVIESLERQQVAERQRSEQNNAVLEQMDQKVKNLERTIALKDIQLAEHDLRMQCMEFASFDGTLLWRITDIQKKRQEAVTGKVTSLYSPAFYSGKMGYKMCARIYLNGDGMGKGSHVSLFFVLMRGHYDALLPWPFQQKVTLVMLDQNFREHTVDTFRPDPASSSFRRPVSEMNIASGCPLFLPLARLTDGGTGYIKDDVIFVKVIVDTEGLDKFTELNPLKGPLPAPPTTVKK